MTTTTRRDIDRTTNHTCEMIEIDRAYYAKQGRPLRECVNCDAPINVYYVQFAHICAECRRECLDYKDVRHDNTCAYCEAPL